MVPTCCPYRVCFRMFVPIYSPGARNFHKLISSYQSPRFTIPFRQGTCFYIKMLQGFRPGFSIIGIRSEEHTSELQSRENLVCRLLLEKKNSSVSDEIHLFFQG